MGSLGGGAVLLVMAIVGLMVADDYRIRILCGVVIGLYLVCVAYAFASGELDFQYLMIPLLLFTFGWFVRDVVKHYGKY